MAATTPNFHFAALRVSALHILRAAGFHSTRPSVLDTFVNIIERYLILLATRTAAHAETNHNSLTPSLSDVRLALTDCGLLLPALATSEDTWTEDLRRPPDQYDDVPFGSIRSQKDRITRDYQDTADVRAFIEWIRGDRNREIRRVAEQLPDHRDDVRIAGPGGDGTGAVDDFITTMKKKHKAVVDEERWAGTVLGRDADFSDIIIEGSDAQTIEDWEKKLQVLQDPIHTDGDIAVDGSSD